MAGEVKRFQRVLQVRETERRITQSELAEKMQEEESIKTMLLDMETTRDNALADFCAGKAEVFSPQQLWFERQSLDVMEKNLDFGRKKLEFCKNQIEETKVQLLEKHRNVQLMEKYVEKLKDRETKKMLLDEQNNIDDITSIRFLRNQREGAGI